MKPIAKDELYEHLGQFLKSKGIELRQGSYSKSIQAGCSLLADAINLSQAGIEKAKTELDKQLNQVREVIHTKTAPKSPPMPKPPVTPPPVGKTNNKEVNSKVQSTLGKKKSKKA